MSEEMQQDLSEAVETTTPETSSDTIQQTMEKAYDRVNTLEQKDEPRRFVKDNFARKVNAVKPDRVRQPSPETQAPRQAPNSVPAVLRDKLNAADPAVRDWVNRREAESHRRITELGQAAKASESIRQVALAATT
jgi:hypothetical protein